MPMRVLIVLDFAVDAPEDIPAVLKAIDPPRLPFFNGTVDVVIDPHAAELRAWLDEE